MRIKTVSLDGYSFGVTYPENFIISHSPGSYVLVRALNKYIGDMTLRFELPGTNIAGIDITREMTENGSVVFPFADILDYLAGQTDGTIVKNVTLTLIVGTDNIDIYSISALVGASDIAVYPFSVDSEDGFEIYQKLFPKKIIAYKNGPSGSDNVPIFFPMKNNMKVPVQYGKQFADTPEQYNGNGWLYVDISGTYAPDFTISLYLGELPGVFTPRIEIDIHVDECAEGIFTHWIDRHGFEFYFRWDVEKITENAENADSYIALSETLDPYELDVKTSQTTYALQSGMIEQGVFDYVSSILSSQKIEYFDNNLGKWMPCCVEEAETEDNGDDYKNLTINITKNNCTIR